MKEIHTNILIAGAGPSGSSVGICLQKENMDCLIVDKSEFPREKLCGGLITESGMNELEYLDVSEENSVFYRPAKIRFFDKENKIFEYESDAKYAVVDRRQFDCLLLDRYRQFGGKAILGERISCVDLQHKFVLTSAGNKIHYEYLIGADGANSVIRRYLNKEKPRQAFCCEIHTDAKVSDGYPLDGINVLFRQIGVGFAWIFEGRDKTAIGIGGLEEDNKKVVDLLTDICGSAHNVKGAFVPYGEIPPIRADHDVFLIGDAAGYVDPILGEGIAYALQSGRKLAAVLKEKDKKAAYAREFRDLTKMVTYGRRLQRFFFTPFINKAALAVFRKHKNLTIRLCEALVMRGNIKYYEIRKILRVIFYE